MALPPCCLLLLFLAGAQARVSYAGHSVLRVAAAGEQQYQSLEELRASGHWDFWSEVVSGRPVDIRAPLEMRTELEGWLEEQGMEWSVMVEDVGRLMEAELATNSSRLSADHPMDWTDYHSLEDIYKWFDFLEAAYDFCQQEIIGQSGDGQDMIVMKVCKGGCGNKPAMWIDSGIHAREWIAPAVATWMLNQLVEENGENELTKDLDWYFLPSHNPDGYRISREEDRLWRKTNTYYTDGDSNPAECRGVDANRNWAHHWGETLGYDHCALDYRGPEPWSEVEVTNVRDWVFDRKNSIKFFQTLHSYGQLVLTPWGYTDTPAPGYDKMLELGIRGNEALFAVHGTTYQVGCTTGILYKASGISMDWMLAEAQIPYVYSIELRDEGFPHGFLLPPDQIIPNAQEVWAFHKVAAEHIIAEYAGP